MRLGVVTAALSGRSLEDALAFVRECGFDSIELACAGFQTDLTFGDPGRLASDRDARERWQELIASHGLAVNALALHGQPLSPDPEVAAAYRGQFRSACELAEAIGVTRLTLLAGLPEGAEGDRAPCWVASSFPPVNQDILRWQWAERVVPYWREQGEIAAAHGCLLCFEMHPSDVVYNPRSLRRLREQVGPVVGCNFDPSHLFWQGIDPLAAMVELRDVIYHVHAKDTGIVDARVRVDGVLETAPFAEFANRSWSFRTVGDGHGEGFWRSFFATLRELGYDGEVSIEHEDEYLPVDDGIRRGIELVRRVAL